MGRPPTAALLALEDILDAVLDRLDDDLPVHCEDVATDLGVSRRALAGRVVALTGAPDWPTWVSAVNAAYRRPVGDDASMKRIAIPLSDETFTRLRRQALAELRDPRLEARRIIEQALDRNEPTPIRRPKGSAA